MPIRLAQKHTFDWARLLSIDVVHLNVSLITAEFVDKLQKHGFIAYGSNLDSAEQIHQGLERGINSFSTGHLDTALRLRDRFVDARS